jgi:hypothetical protein
LFFYFFFHVIQLKVNEERMNSKSDKHLSKASLGSPPPQYRFCLKKSRNSPPFFTGLQKVTNI